MLVSSRLLLTTLLALSYFCTDVYGRLHLKKKSLSIKTVESLQRFHKESEGSAISKALSCRGGNTAKAMLDNIHRSYEALIEGTDWSFAGKKLMLQLLLTGFNIVCWSIPLASKELKESPYLLSIMNCFSGGIFLILSFTHLIPEAISSLAGTNIIEDEHGHHGGFVALQYVLVGFLLMVFIEKVAFDHDHHHHHHHHHHDHHESQHHDHTHIHSSKQSNPIVNFVQNFTQKLHHKPVNTNKPIVKPQQKNTGVSSALILCIAMSIHAFFEAAALSMARDMPAALFMTLCIALHQPAESLALVIAFLKNHKHHQLLQQQQEEEELVQQQSQSPESSSKLMSKPSSRSGSMRYIVFSLLLYSSVALLGNISGIVVKALADESLEAIVVALTAGTFLYVGATEIISEEFEHGSKKQKLQKFLIMLLGVGTMAIVSRFTEQFDHHHH